MALLRRVIGDALRARRQGQHRTLREISTAANVSLGYLSEIERGQKEASSELLAAICEALGSQLSEVLREASDSLATTEHTDPVVPGTLLPDRALPETPLADAPMAPAGVDAAGRAAEHAVTHASDRAVGDGPVAAAVADRETTEGEVSVSVRRDGPLRTTLRAVRTRRPGQPVARTG